MVVLYPKRDKPIADVDSTVSLGHLMKCSINQPNPESDVKKCLILFLALFAPLYNLLPTGKGCP
jgi:hypothetical protein